MELEPGRGSSDPVTAENRQLNVFTGVGRILIIHLGTGVTGESVWFLGGEGVSGSWNGGGEGRGKRFILGYGGIFFLRRFGDEHGG